MHRLIEKIEALPLEYQTEIEDFVDFLSNKKLFKTKNKPNFKWAGALKEIKNEYTSVELQHKISDLRISDL